MVKLLKFMVLRTSNSPPLESPDERFQDNNITEILISRKGTWSSTGKVLTSFQLNL